MSKQSYQRSGDVAWSKMHKMNAELFTLTYGALVTQVLMKSVQMFIGLNMYSILIDPI